MAEAPPVADGRIHKRIVREAAAARFDNFATTSAATWMRTFVTNRSRDARHGRTVTLNG
jgi:hypothetical protein